MHRGFSRELQSALDRLLQTALQAAQAEGATRDSLERTSHSFALNVRPGALCRTGFVGCVVPSCDRVGRFFPLCVGLEVLPGPVARFRPPVPWLPLALVVEVCKLIYTAQAAPQGPDELLAQLPPAAAWGELMERARPFDLAQDSTVPLVPQTTSQFAYEGPESSMHPLDRATCSQLPMLAEALGAVITHGAHFDLYFATRSLLSWSCMAALFDGRWEHWGWELQRLARPAESEEDDTVAPAEGEDLE
ncbi:MAG: DUF2094 domain-containing protein [Rubrivivax sp.]|nr:DUF2094 domain-containing protein [Rubrivivax sp.]